MSTPSWFNPDDLDQLEEPQLDITEDNEPPAPIDLTLADPGKRKPNALKYENKMRSVFANVTKLLIKHPATLPDAATILVHGSPVAVAWGDLAAVDPKVAKGIDMLTDTTENPYLTAVASTLPMLLQVMRNHEPQLEPAARGFKIPFLKDRAGQTRRIRIPFKIGIRLGGLRGSTNDPSDMARYVFTEESRAYLANKGVVVAPFKN